MVGGAPGRNADPRALGWAVLPSAGAAGLAGPWPGAGLKVRKPGEVTSSRPLVEELANLKFGARGRGHDWVKVTQQSRGWNSESHSRPLPL